MSTPEITTVTLPCIRDGDNVYLYQPDSNKRIMFSVNGIKIPVSDDLVSFKERAAGKGSWLKACASIRDRLNTCTKHATLSGWDKWSRDRVVSIRQRRYQPPQGNRKQFTNTSRPDWKTAHNYMRQQLHDTVRRRELCKWKRWSNNTAKNTNRRLYQMGQKIKAMDLKNLIEAQGYRCALTGVELEPSTASADHIQPVSDGGRNDIENIQILHHKVNAAKGTMPNDEFIKMCKNVVEWVTGRNETCQAQYCPS